MFEITFNLPCSNCGALLAYAGAVCPACGAIDFEPDAESDDWLGEPEDSLDDIWGD